MSEAPLPTVLSLCDRTGNMVRPWAEAGFPCVIVDVQHPKGETEFAPNITALGRDVYDLGIAGGIGIVFAFPPCTDLASSGARWFESKGLPATIGALQLVDRCRRLCESAGCRWMIENPVGRLSTCWRKPDFTFDPCGYGGYLDPPGDRYTKRTCLWIGGGFAIPFPKYVEPTEGSRMHRLPPSPDRADLRSATPMGFARAVFAANAPACEVAA